MRRKKCTLLSSLRFACPRWCNSSNNMAWGYSGAKGGNLVSSRSHPLLHCASQGSRIYFFNLRIRFRDTSERDKLKIAHECAAKHHLYMYIYMYAIMSYKETREKMRGWPGSKPCMPLAYIEGERASSRGGRSHRHARPWLRQKGYAGEPAAAAVGR